MRDREIKRRLKAAGKLADKLDNEFRRTISLQLDKLTDEELLAVINSGPEQGDSPHAIIRREARWHLDRRGEKAVYGPPPWLKKYGRFEKRSIHAETTKGTK